jgi:hypothetical protein
VREVLGSPAALYLAAAGVGTLGLVDFDVVDESNLHRQVLFGSADVGRSKLVAARERLAQTNPHVRVVPFEERLTSQNALEILKDFDVVADGTDNFATRYLVNDACVLLGKPNVYASIFRFEGQARSSGPRRGPAIAACSPSRRRRTCSLLRGGRSPRGPAGSPRRSSGDGNDQADPRNRGASDREAPAGRRARDALPRDAGAEGSAVRRVRAQPDGDGSDRLRRVLRRSRASGIVRPHARK